MTPEEAERQQKMFALLGARQRQVEEYWDYIHSRYGNVAVAPGWYERGGILPEGGFP